MLKGFGVSCAAIVLTVGAGNVSGNEGLATRTTSTEQRRELDNLLRQAARNAEQLQRKSAELQTRIREHDQGFTNVASKNFVVGAPSKSFATAVLAQAEQIRRKIALTWFGQELPEGKEFALIHVELSDTTDEGLTLLCGPGRRFQGHHRIWLTTGRELALGSTLRHEIAHVVLNAGFPTGMPAWANEGIASLCDDSGRIATRHQIVRSFARSHEWPSVGFLMNRPAIDASDESAYAVAVSLTEFFLARGDHAQFLNFVADGSRVGWDVALNTYYHIRGVNDLQNLWQSWASRTLQKQ